MRHEFRLGRGARWFGALGVTLALAAVPSVASAQSQTNYGAGTPGIGTWNPEYTNTPYLAWNGEVIRLEKCVGADPGAAAALQQFGTSANWQVESWTGDHQDTTTAPQLEANTEKVFYSSDYQDPNSDTPGGVCAEADVVANTPGLARIELDVSLNTGAPGAAGYETTFQLLSHEFLAAWMQLNTPTISSASGGSVNAGSTADPLDVKVTGTIPLDGNSAIESQVGQDSLTLPGDWALMASKLAVDYTPNNGTASGRDAENDWDTSGESSNATGNGAFSGCPTPFSSVASDFVGAYVPTVDEDNGDNCTGGDEFGPFSTSTGLSSDQTIGPFDQVDPQDTDLPNGALNSYDAPMPAALVDVAIGQNSGSSSDTSGIGSLVSADKTDIDSRDGLGDDSAHNLYAPFYDAYIPATARPTDASSGIDGAYGNDFTGFLNIPGPGSEPQQYAPLSGEGLYHFWDTADLASNPGTTTKCLDADGSYRSTPSGAYEVDVYTDQNGEAMVDYEPGTGAFYDNLGADKNNDGGCDLESMSLGNGNTPITSLGSSSITATAEYPYKPSNFGSTSATTSISVNNEFDKSLSYAPKGSGVNDQFDKIVIARGQDVDGSPLAGETVCFTVQGSNAGVTRFTGSVNGVYYGGSRSTSDPNGSGSNRTCLVTDQNGYAAIEVLDSDTENVDVIADWTDEGLLRNLDVPFGPNSSPTGGNVPTSPVSSGNGSATIQPLTPSSSGATAVGTTSPTVAEIKTVSPALAQKISSQKATPAKSTVQILHLVSTVRGRYLVVRVKSGRHSVRMLVTLKVGHKLVHRTLTVPTNRTVHISLGKSRMKFEGARLIG